MLAPKAKAGFETPQGDSPAEQPVAFVSVPALLLCFTVLIVYTFYVLNLFQSSMWYRYIHMNSMDMKA